MFPNASAGDSQATAAAGAVPTADGAGNVAWLAPGAAGSFAIVRQPTLFTTPGADTFTRAPDSIGIVDIECIGGGSGAAADGLSNSGAGGEYAATFGVPIADGEVLDVVVGAGGTANNASDVSNPGGASSVSDDTPTLLCEANGGGATFASSRPAEGGTGGTGDITINGGPGGTLGNNHGGAAPNGGAGGYVAALAAFATPAVQPGGGAGGTTGAGVATGTGADGWVIVWDYVRVAL